MSLKERSDLIGTRAGKAAVVARSRVSSAEVKTAVTPVGSAGATSTDSHWTPAQPKRRAFSEKEFGGNVIFSSKQS